MLSDFALAFVAFTSFALIRTSGPKGLPRGATFQFQFQFQLL